MLPAALILAFSGLSLPPQLRTLSAEDHTDDAVASLSAPPQKSDFERRFSLEARFGVAAPTGALGVAAEFAFVPRLGIGCGIGTNILGAEYACWLRVRPILGRRRALTLASGVSSAPFTQNEAWAGGVFGPFTGAVAQGREGPGPLDRDFERAYWLNTDLGYESRRGAFLFRVFGGAAALLNPSDGVVQASSSPDAEPADPVLHVLVYAGLGVGFAE